MGHTWRLFQLTQGFRWRLVGRSARIDRLCRRDWTTGAIRICFSPGISGETVYHGVLANRWGGGVYSAAGYTGIYPRGRGKSHRWKSSSISVSLYQHVLALGPGYFDQRRTGDVVMSLVEGLSNWRPSSASTSRNSP